MTLAQVIELTDEAKAGKLAVIGLRWIQWLAKVGREGVRARLEAETIKARPKIANLISEEHARHLSAISSLFAVSVMMLDFIAQEAPAFLDEYRKISNVGWLHLLASAQEQAEEGEEAGPLSQLLIALSQSISTGTVYLDPRTMGGDPHGTPGGRVVGYYQNDYIWLTKWLTMGWYESELRSQGRNATVNWSSIVQDGKENFGGTNLAEYYYDGEAKKSDHGRMLKLPLSALTSMMHSPEFDYSQPSTDVTRNDVTADEF